MVRCARIVAMLSALGLIAACGAIVGIKDLTRGGPDDVLDEGGGPSSDASSDASGDVPAESGCGDVMTSSNHCGRCDHSCLGGDCNGGRCQPIVLATNQGTVSGVALDATYVYFTSLSQNLIARVPKAGGKVDTLAAAPGVRLAKRIAVNSTHVYWANAEPLSGAIARCPITGCTGAPEVLAQPEEPIGIALDASYVYWADRNAQQIRKKPIIGGPDALVATPPDLPVAVVVDGAQVFYIQDFSGQVHKSNPADGGNIFIGKSGQSGKDLALDPTFVYWGAMMDFGEPGRIARAPRVGGGPTELIGEAQGDPMALAIDGARVFWTAWKRQTDGGVISAAVYSCEQTGCGAGPTVVAPAQDLPRGIAIDATAVYWGANGVIMKLAK